MRIILTGILSILFTQSIFAEGKLDSLYVDLQNSNEDTSMVKTFEELSWEYHRNQPERTIFYAKRS